MKKSLFLIPALALALASCSNDDPSSVVNEDENGLATNFLSINLVPAPDNYGSRADETGGSQSSKDNPDDAIYEEGYSSENAVSTVRFYFFDAVGNAAGVKKVDGGYVNYFDWKNPTENGKDMPNVEKQLQAVVIINTKEGDQLPSQVVAILNPDVEGLSSTNTNTQSVTLEDLRKRTKDYAQTVTGSSASNFVMMNAVYATSDKKEVIATAITAENYGATEDAAKLKPVNIYVERNVAKVRVKFDTSLQTKPDDYILLKDQNNKEIKVGEKQVYLKLGKWSVTAESNISYLSKHINAEWETTNIFGSKQWNYAPYFRSYWALNPTDGFQQKWYSYNEINGTKDDTGRGKNYDGTITNSMYTNENAPQINGLTADSKNAEIAELTKVLIAGTLVDEDGKEIEVARYAGVDMIGEETLMTQILNSLKGKIYSYSGTGDNVSFSDIQPTDVEFQKASEAGQAFATDEKNETTTGRYYVYLQIREGVNKTWTTSNNKDSYQQNLVTNINQFLVDNVGHAQIYKSGLTYYYFPIKHLGDSGKIGYYGVVRNHIYDCTIKTLTGLGTPVYDPDETIYPEKPDEDDTFIAAQINILSWRLVTDEVSLTW